MTPEDTIPPEVQQAFSTFCRTNGWTEAEILTLLMLSAIKEDTDLVTKVLRQRYSRRQAVRWFTELPYWPKPSELED